MANLNPKASIDALFPRPIDVGFGVEVLPLSLGHYALLEKINSYLVSVDHEPESVEVVKTLYICTHPSKEVFSNFEDLDSIALEWADNLPPCMIQIISEATLKQIEAMRKVIPVSDDSGKKKVQVTGS